MARIYCNGHHGTGGGLCSTCGQLHVYAIKRLESCPFQAGKPACNHCEVHCYSPAKRDEIQRVMRYAGPRMLFRYPLLSIQHLLDTFRKSPSMAPKSTTGKAKHRGSR